jgi:hypothetical protein
LTARRHAANWQATMPVSDRQHTLAKSASLTGTSLHTGEQVTLTLQPAPENFGFKFRRVDLEDKPFIPALVEKVQKVERATTIAEGGVNVHTVEHVISALAGMGVDNAIIEMDANEPPIADGSALPYVELIRKAGLKEQSEARKVFESASPSTRRRAMAPSSPSCRTKNSASPARMSARTAASPSFSPWRSRPRFTKRKSPRPAPLFITKTSPRCWRRA